MFTEYMSSSYPQGSKPTGDHFSVTVTVEMVQATEGQQTPRDNWPVPSKGSSTSTLSVVVKTVVFWETISDVGFFWPDEA